MSRVRSVDIARGAVMVLMAIDHVRVFAAVPAGGPTASLFFTRWVTHFCAPVFVFLAGVSIYLHKNPANLTPWLLKRGAWLVILELTYFRFVWTFNMDYQHYMLAGVIWMIGWCMILMAALVHLPVKVNAAFGLAMIAGHNLASALISHGDPSWFWRIFYFGGGISLAGGEEPNFFVLYSIVPWIGVMAAGYAFGLVLRNERICYAIGGAAIVAFLVLRYFNIYGDRPWSGSPLAFLNTTKYPASFQFLLMTLGPTIALLPLLERAKGWAADWLTVFGRVPMFYYTLHIPLIHLMAIAIAAVRTPQAMPWLFANHPLLPPRAPEGYMWSLVMLYAVTALAVAILYFACRWYQSTKSFRK